MEKNKRVLLLWIPGWFSFLFENVPLAVGRFHHHHRALRRQNSNHRQPRAALQVEDTLDLNPKLGPDEMTSGAPGGRRVPVVTFLLCLCSSQLHGPIDSHQTCFPEIPVGRHHLRGESLNSFSPCWPHKQAHEVVKLLDFC